MCSFELMTYEGVIRNCTLHCNNICLAADELYISSCSIIIFVVNFFYLCQRAGLISFHSLGRTLCTH